MAKPVKFVFFGTPDIAVIALDTLFARGFAPALIVTAPDRPRGRGLVLSPTPVKKWADEHTIPALTPAKLSDESFLAGLRDIGADVFVVVAYGKILPPALLSIPPKGTLNMHPSVLPRHRGPAPLESQILTETDGGGVGVSIMALDEEMDHGPVLAQKKDIPEIVENWPMKKSALEDILARTGGELLAETLPAWVDGEITAVTQDHDKATASKKISSEDAEIDLAGDPRANYLKILAYDSGPKAHFYAERSGKKIRVIVTGARLKEGSLEIDTVIPEGKHEMPYKSFLLSK